jgi:hypothetical protein
MSVLLFRVWGHEEELEEPDEALHVPRCFVVLLPEVHLEVLHQRSIGHPDDNHVIISQTSRKI